MDLIRKYHRVESQFQKGSFDKCAVTMRDRNKDDIKAVVEDILSHSAVTMKNETVVQLMVIRRTKESILILCGLDLGWCNYCRIVQCRISRD